LEAAELRRKQELERRRV